MGLLTKEAFERMKDNLLGAKEVKLYLDPLTYVIKDQDRNPICTLDDVYQGNPASINPATDSLKLNFDFGFDGSNYTRKTVDVEWGEPPVRSIMEDYHSKINYEMAKAIAEHEDRVFAKNMLQYLAEPIGGITAMSRDFIAKAGLPTVESDNDKITPESLEELYKHLERVNPLFACERKMGDLEKRLGRLEQRMLQLEVTVGEYDRDKGSNSQAGQRRERTGT